MHIHICVYIYIHPPLPYTYEIVLGVFSWKYSYTLFLGIKHSSICTKAQRNATSCSIENTRLMFLSEAISLSDDKTEMGLLILRNRSYQMKVFRQTRSISVYRFPLYIFFYIGKSCIHAREARPRSKSVPFIAARYLTSPCLCA